MQLVRLPLLVSNAAGEAPTAGGQPAGLSEQQPCVKCGAPSCAAEAMQPDSCVRACSLRGTTSPSCASRLMPGAATEPSPTSWTWMQPLCGLPMPGRVRGRGSLRGSGAGGAVGDCAVLGFADTFLMACSCAGCPCHAMGPASLRCALGAIAVSRFAAAVTDCTAVEAVCDRPRKCSGTL